MSYEVKTYVHGHLLCIHSVPSSYYASCTFDIHLVNYIIVLLFYQGLDLRQFCIYFVMAITPTIPEAANNTANAPNSGTMAVPVIIT